MEPDDVWRTLADRHRGPLRSLLRTREWITDVLICAAYLGFTLLPQLVVGDQRGAWALPGLFVAAAALCFRRRWPRLVMIIALAVEVSFFLLDVPVAVPGLGPILALYAVGRKFAPAHAQALGLLCSALEAATLVFLAARQPLADGSRVGTLILMLAVVIGFMLAANVASVGLGSALRNAALHEAELQAWARRAQELARERERNRIAGEMHDIVAHSLSVMIALSDGARRVVTRDQDRAAEVMTDVASTGRRALADLRRSLGLLRADGDAPLGPAGDPGGFEEMLDGFRAAGLPLQVDLEGAMPEDPAQRLTVVRIVQESLTNALRYAKDPHQVVVELTADPAGVRIRVRDDGVDAGRRPRSHGSGIGLSGLHERAGLFGGSVTAGPLQQGGWGVDAWVPAPSDPHKDVAATASATFTPTPPAAVTTPKTGE